MIREQYYFTREVFNKILLKYTTFDSLMSYFVTDSDRTENFYFWHCDDEFFIMEYHSMVTINWYKRLGSFNRISCDMTQQEFDLFCKRLGEEIDNDY